MKNLILIIFLITSVSVFGKVNPVKSNRAIEEVSWALESARWDYDQAMTLNFEENYQRSDLDCEVRSYDEAIKLFSRAINGFRDYFPDEDLPYNTALEELNSILSARELNYCVIDDGDIKVWQMYLEDEFLFSVEQ